MQIKRQKPQTWLGRERERDRGRQLERESERETGSGERRAHSLTYTQSRQHFHSLFVSTRLTMRHTNKFINMSVDMYVCMVLWAYRKLAHRWTRHGHLIWFNRVNRTKIINKQQKKKQKQFAFIYFGLWNAYLL